MLVYASIEKHIESIQNEMYRITYEERDYPVKDMRKRLSKLWTEQKVGHGDLDKIKKPAIKAYLLDALKEKIVQLRKQQLEQRIAS